MPAPGDRERRRALGAWYTPPWLVDRVLDTVLADLPRPPARILDPSCGDGRFLAAARIRWPHAELYGIDIDPAAVDAARRGLGAGARVVAGDGLDPAAVAALCMGTGEPLAFDLVVGNPPFLNQLARGTSRGGRSSIGGGPYADTAALFLARAVELATPDGGAVALVLPQSVLATRDAADIRRQVGAGAAVTGLWLADERVFDADVHTVVLSCRRGVRQGPVRRWRGSTFTPHPDTAMPTTASWSPLLADAYGVPDVGHATTRGCVGDVAAATADFRDQYYGLVGHVGDDRDGPALVTSGLIELGSCAWGRRSVRFGGRRYEAPRVAVDELSEEMRRWAARRLSRPKVLLAAQTSVLEAFPDVEGRLLPAVPVISVVPTDRSDTWKLTAVLCSPVASAWAARTVLGTGLSPRSLRLRAGQVGDVPLPAGSIRGAVPALQRGELERYGRIMTNAYELDAEALLTWWLPGARKAAAPRRTDG